MCGIAGLYAGEDGAVSLTELTRMIAMLGHRGPDGYGLYRDERVGLAHARLSLVDLAGGAQPMEHGEGALWLAFNGEIFNYRELRQSLIALGHHFKTQSDSEVILHGYARYGARCWQMLNGQFAFALWDRPRRRLWLVRDRLGILPLFYARAGRVLLFASEAKALFAGGRVAPSLDASSIAESFCFWSPLPGGSAFAGVAAVPPATALAIEADLTSRAQRYWEPSPNAAAAPASLDEAAEQLSEKLARAVDFRLRADVPVGAYLSGGLDSSVIGSFAAERLGGNLASFGIGFTEARFDESCQQAAVVCHLGTRHHALLCDGAAMAGALEEVVWQCETPLLRTSPVPLYLLAQSVRAAGIKAVLSGEGADELLAGYAIFGEDQIRRFWARRPDSRLRPALLARIHPEIDGQGLRGGALWQRFFARRLGETAHPFYAHLLRWENNGWGLRLLDGAAARFDLAAAMQRLAADLPAGWQDWDPLLRAQLVEMRSFMSSYLLSAQGDRVAMAHGIEVRYPFLDPELVDFCLALPRRHKRVGLRDKLALRRLAARRLPPAIAARPKQPYRAPIAAALSPDSLHAALACSLVERQRARSFLDALARRGGRPASERESMALIGLATLGMLERCFAEGFAARQRRAEERLARLQPQVMEDRAGAVSGGVPRSDRSPAGWGAGRAL